jgi:hypothetical protein
VHIRRIVLPASALLLAATLSLPAITGVAGAAVNTPPTVEDDQVAIFPGAPAEIYVLENDYDEDGDPLELTSWTQGAQGGTVDCPDDYVCTYEPPTTTFEGEDTFSYTVSDGTATASAQVTVVVADCPDLADGLDAGTIVASETWDVCPSPVAHAVTDVSPTYLDPVGGTVALLTTGNWHHAGGPNDLEDSGTGHDASHRNAYDVSVKRLELSVPEGHDCMSFDAVFASEEFPEFVGKTYNDAFIAELDESTWSLDPETSEISAPANFAVDPAGRSLSVNSVFFSNVIEQNGTEYDGATPVLRVRTPITSGNHTLYLSIFDAGDDIFDSAVFLDHLHTAASGAACEAGAVTPGAARADFDDSGSTDVAVYRPDGNAWFVQGGLTTGWGVPGDVPVPADYNGDGRTDVAVFRPSDQSWYVQPSASFPGGLSTQWGVPGDVPVPGDYDGDGADEIAVFRPSDQTWYSQTPGSIATQWGVSGDVPVPADYDGDGDDDVAVFRPTDQTWYSQGAGGIATQWGMPGDQPVPVDFDGDGDDDVAVYRAFDQTWYAQGAGALATQWGVGGDIAVPGDYDADGDADVAVFRPSDATWYVQPSGSYGGLATQWGTGGDVPVVVPFAIWQRYTTPPGPPMLVAFEHVQSCYYTGSTATAGYVVTLSGPAQGDTFVAVTSSNPSAVTVTGGGVTIPNGMTSSHGYLDVISPGTATLSAQLGSGPTRQVQVEARNPSHVPALVSVTVPASLKAGATGQGAVQLDCQAQPGGALVSLSSSNPAVAGVPASVTVAAGARSATFTVTAGAPGSATIAAGYGGVDKQDTITVTP